MSDILERLFFLETVSCLVGCLFSSFLKTLSQQTSHMYIVFSSSGISLGHLSGVRLSVQMVQLLGRNSVHSVVCNDV